MKDERCETCKFWKRLDEPNEKKGSCRAHPPQCIDSAPYQAFPDLSHDDWCGEWKAKDKQEGEGK